jgi:hypothetical protein
MGYSGMAMKSFRTLNDAELWLMSRHVFPSRKDNHIDTSVKNQEPQSQEDSLLINAAPVKVEQGLSILKIPNGNVVNGGSIFGGVVDTKEVQPDPKQRVGLSPLLSDEQRHVIELARQGRNIFFTGSAGKCCYYFVLSSDAM